MQPGPSRLLPEREGTEDLVAPQIGTSRSPAVLRWTQEWLSWQGRPETRAALARWQRHSCLAGLVAPEAAGALAITLAACGRDLSVPQELADTRLASVVAEALRGDQVATRLVLQRVLPALVQRAAARARLHHLAFAAVLDDLLAQAWLVISQYPLQARPTKVAVNIIRDAEYRLFGYVPITHRNTTPVAPEHLPAARLGGSGSGFGEPERVLSELPIMLLDEVAAGFPVEDARLLTQLFLFGLTVSEIATAEGVSARWIRCRRQRALRRLAEHMGYPPLLTPPQRRGNRDGSPRPGSGRLEAPDARRDRSRAVGGAA